MDEKSVGRPSLYRPEYCQLLIEHMEKGLSYEAFAGVVGVSKQTIYDWEKANEEFLDAKNRGIERARLFWEQKGLDGLFSETFEDKDAKTRSSKSINAPIWLINMKNRFGWRDKQPGEVDTVVNNNNSNSNQISPQSDEAIEVRFRQLMDQVAGKVKEDE